MAKPIITNRQRLAQEKKLMCSLAFLEIALEEIKTATFDEVSQTLEIALEKAGEVNSFLRSRRG